MAERDGYAPGTPSWVDLTTPDLDAALAFYGGLFGWEFEDAGAEAGHYHQALVRGKRVAGLGPAQPGSPRSRTGRRTCRAPTSTRTPRRSPKPAAP